jgi:hypothetical protein
MMRFGNSSVVNNGVTVYSILLTSSLRGDSFTDGWSRSDFV